MRRRSTLVALALPLALLACSDDAEEADVPDATVPASDPDDGAPTTLVPPAQVYDRVDDPVPDGEPGELLVVEEVDPGDLPASALYRVLHLSASVAGEPIVVTGVVALPEGEPPEGGWPVLSWAHGTTGIADACAPSLDPVDAVAVGADLLADGFVVAATDYEGLGTPGRHPYVLGESEGRGVLDVVRAARQLDERVGDRVVVWGHSQGGHAALFANQIAADWAPELEVVATVAGAPPSQLSLISAALQGGPFQHYILMTGAGWAEAYDADLSLVATPRALELLPAVDEECSSGLAEVFNAVPPEELLAADPATVEPWASLLLENDPGRFTEPGAAPVLIIHGGEDEQIPVASSEILLGQLCAIGQDVERRVYEGESHAGVIGPSLGEMRAWIDARLAGEPTEPDCG